MAYLSQNYRYRVQRSYFLDWDIEKALRKKSLEEGKNLTETVNEILRKGVEEYLLGII